MIICSNTVVLNRCDRTRVALAAILLTIALLLYPLPPCAASEAPVFLNPILRGGYPDPSICRSADGYYLVNSSLEYFPGLPIHRSRDLVNWELVGYGLHREDQVTGAVNLVDVQSNGGIHAPTIRCRDGIFYIITTNVYTSANGRLSEDYADFDWIRCEFFERPQSARRKRRAAGKPAAFGLATSMTYSSSDSARRRFLAA